jgi:hypothetical protein
MVGSALNSNCFWPQLFNCFDACCHTRCPDVARKGCSVLKQSEKTFMETQIKKKFLVCELNQLKTLTKIE